jgi:Uma2 family endonuclease
MVHERELPPIVLPVPLDDAALERVSELNPGWRFERDDDGGLVVSPTSTDGGAQSGEAFGQLRDYVRSGAGGRAFDSSTGFKMSTRAVRSPDAAWMSPERAAGIAPEARTGYWRVCPDVVIEVRSESDRWTTVCAKIDMYAREGAQYAVAIDPFTRAVYARGEPPAGLTLDIDAIIGA